MFNYATCSWCDGNRVIFIHILYVVYKKEHFAYVTSTIRRQQFHKFYRTSKKNNEFINIVVIIT